MLELKIRRVGSSLGVLLPKKALDEAGIREGDRIEIPRIAPRAAHDYYGIWARDPVRIETGDDA